MSRTCDPQVEWGRCELDHLHAELVDLHAVDPDVALLRLAKLNGRAAAIRGRLSRSPSIYVSGFLSRELEPFVDALAVQAKLIERVGYLRRGAS